MMKINTRKDDGSALAFVLIFVMVLSLWMGSSFMLTQSALNNNLDSRSDKFSADVNNRLEASVAQVLSTFAQGQDPNGELLGTYTTTTAGEVDCNPGNSVPTGSVADCIPYEGSGTGYFAMQDAVVLTGTTVSPVSSSIGKSYGLAVTGSNTLNVFGTVRNYSDTWIGNVAVAGSVNVPAPAVTAATLSSVSVSKKTIKSKVATLTLGQNPTTLGFAVGDLIKAIVTDDKGTYDAKYSGLYKITALTSNTLSYANNNGDQGLSNAKGTVTEITDTCVKETTPLSQIMQVGSSTTTQYGFPAECSGQSSVDLGSTYYYKSLQSARSASISRAQNRGVVSVSDLPRCNGLSITAASAASNSYSSMIISGVTDASNKATITVQTTPTVAVGDLITVKLGGGFDVTDRAVLSVDTVAKKITYLGTDKNKSATNGNSDANKKVTTPTSTNMTLTVRGSNPILDTSTSVTLMGTSNTSLDSTSTTSKLFSISSLGQPTTATQNDGKLGIYTQQVVIKVPGTVAAPTSTVIASKKPVISTYGGNTYNIPTPVFTVIKKALDKNIAKLTFKTSTSFVAGDDIIVSGVDTTFDGTWTILTVTKSTLTNDTVTFGYTRANVGSTSATGTAMSALAEGPYLTLPAGVYDATAIAGLNNLTNSSIEKDPYGNACTDVSMLQLKLSAGDYYFADAVGATWTLNNPAIRLTGADDSGKMVQSDATAKVTKYAKLPIPKGAVQSYIFASDNPVIFGAGDILEFYASSTTVGTTVQVLSVSGNTFIAYPIGGTKIDPKTFNTYTKSGVLRVQSTVLSCDYSDVNPISNSATFTELTSYDNNLTNSPNGIQLNFGDKMLLAIASGSIDICPINFVRKPKISISGPDSWSSSSSLIGVSSYSASLAFGGQVFTPSSPLTLIQSTPPKGAIGGDSDMNLLSGVIAKALTVTLNNKDATLVIRQPKYFQNGGRRFLLKISVMDKKKLNILKSMCLKTYIDDQYGNNPGNKVRIEGNYSCTN